MRSQICLSVNFVKKDLINKQEKGIKYSVDRKQKI